MTEAEVRRADVPDLVQRYLQELKSNSKIKTVVLIKGDEGWQ